MIIMSHILGKVHSINYFSNALILIRLSITILLSSDLLMRLSMPLVVLYFKTHLVLFHNYTIARTIKRSHIYLVIDDNLHASKKIQPLQRFLYFRNKI